MENVQDPRQHINEEPRDDLHDLVVGFGGMLGFMFIVFLIAVIVKYVIT
ncbi:YqzM family protein [Cohnella sp. REN36]|nr:YqzM family protein [Cohnella sp. REN36]MCC3374601.1 YqzM family protein [Cohnella sp. REN36]